MNFICRNDTLICAYLIDIKNVEFDLHNWEFDLHTFEFYFHKGEFVKNTCINSISLRVDLIVQG